MRKSMNKFAIALAAVVSLGLAIPAFAQEKKDTMPADKMQGGNVGKHNKMGKHGMMVVHHHHHHHHMMGKPEPKPQ
jgi:pentapeptide MXKDX repeat protein